MQKTYTAKISTRIKALLYSGVDECTRRCRLGMEPNLLKDVSSQRGILFNENLLIKCQ